MTSQDRRGDHSPSLHAEQHVSDKTGLFVSIAAFGAALLAVGLAVGSILVSNVQHNNSEAQFNLAIKSFTDREETLKTRAQVSENHWRDMEVLIKSQTAEIERLKQERRK